MENLLNKIFPPKCLFCGQIGLTVCGDCLNKASILNKDYCLVCDHISQSGYTHNECFKLFRRAPVRLISVFSYEGVVREIIRSSKYGRREYLALVTLCLYGLNLLSESVVESLKGFNVVSVPSSKKNLKRRGFNQAEIISKIFCKKFNLKLLKNPVLRHTKTESQYKYGREQRFDSVRDVFTIKESELSSINGNNILVVDDIVTSGATMLEMSKVLYEKGAEKVVCFSLSKKQLER